jgi:hypothetical protein
MSCMQNVRESTKPHPSVLVLNSTLIYYMFNQITYFDFFVVMPHLWPSRWISRIGPILLWVRASLLCLLNSLVMMLIRMSLL